MKKLNTASWLLAAALLGLVSCTTVEQPTPTTSTTTTHESTAVTRPTATQQTTTTHTTGGGY